MSFKGLDLASAKDIGAKLERLAKSFAAGYQGLQNAGRTGISALAADALDPVMRSITLEDSDFMLTKDIPTLNATQTVYSYNVKTSVGTGTDLAGMEAFLPQESTSQYMRVAEVLKVYGIRKSITQMAQFVNDANGYSVDIEQENDTNAALAMAEALERDLYVGGDDYFTSAGEIDANIAANVNGPIRSIRGIQANIREGNSSQRGIPGDFVGYGNNRSVVFNIEGDVMNRTFLDKVVTAVRDSRGAVKEAHCTTSQLAEFRATFFPFERGDLGSLYSIMGAKVTNDEQNALPIQTVGGVIDFIPTVFKYTRFKPVSIIGSVGQVPSTPSVGATPSQGAGASGFKAGEQYSYSVQAVNISGSSMASMPVAATVAADNNYVELAIGAQPGVEYFMVFRSPVEASGAHLGQEMYIGKIVASRMGATTFRDNGAKIPGLDSVLFLPRDKNRAKLAILGNLLNKMELGVRGLAFEVVYASYVGCVVDRPRSFALVDNVFQQREGL